MVGAGSSTTLVSYQKQKRLEGRRGGVLGRLHPPPTHWPYSFATSAPAVLVDWLDWRRESLNCMWDQNTKLDRLLITKSDQSEIGEI